MIVTKKEPQAPLIATKMESEGHISEDAGIMEDGKTTQASTSHNLPQWNPKVITIIQWLISSTMLVIIIPLVKKIKKKFNVRNC